MERDPGRFLEMARRLVVVVHTVANLEREQGPSRVNLSQLTDPELLERTFPVAIPGTPYHHFSTTKELVGAVVQVASAPRIYERVWYEAALGMMDNPFALWH